MRWTVNGIRMDGFSTDLIVSSIDLDGAFCFQTERVDLSIIRFPTIDWTKFGFGPFETLTYNTNPLVGPLGHCKKTGASTGWTNGMIERGQTVNIGGVDFRDVIVVRGEGFLESGDSGALLVTIDNGHETTEQLQYVVSAVDNVTLEQSYSGINYMHNVQIMPMHTL